MNNRKRKIFIALISIIFLSIIIYICYKSVNLFISLKNNEKQMQFKNYIHDLKWKGWLIILALQVLQVFIAFIPGEVVEILSGILYGGIGGLFLCLLGILLGSILIYYFIKLFARKNLDRLKRKLQTYSFLNNPKKIHLYLFIIFLIPGLPKDIFIYLVPFLPIKFSSFVILSLIARIPSTASSTIIGNSLMDGNYLLSLIIFTCFSLIGILVILFNDKILSFLKKDSEKDLNNNDTIEN